MKTQNRKFDKQNGSALILVVVVTVLLAVIGVMFLMVSRASEMESGAVIQNKDLDSAVDTVVARINEVLVEDLFGTDNTRPGIVDAEDGINFDADEPSDFTTHNPILTMGPDALWGTTDDVFLDPGVDTLSFTWDDSIDPGSNGVLDPGVMVNNNDIWLPGNLDDYWLASLEPTWRDDNGTTGNPSDDNYVWPHITDLWGTLQGRSDSLYYQRYVSTEHIYYPQTGRSFWTDPDNETIPAQWNALWQNYEVAAYNVPAKIITPKDRTRVILRGATGTVAIPNPWDDKTQTNLYGARADADGDGVADSRWVQVPGLTTSRGEPVFAAVRIIDNCAMLNLNAAHCFYQEPHDEPTPLYVDTLGDPVSTFAKPWFYDGADYTAGTLFHDNQSTGSGRYITEINYLAFLRGSDLNGAFFGPGAGDDWYNLMVARGFYKLDAFNNIIPFSFSPWESHSVVKDIENPIATFQFFDIGDELELRNRYLVTSKVEARFERSDVANFSLDSGSTDYAALQVPRDNSGNTIDIWKERVDPANFDAWSMWTSPTGGSVPYKYDRRHVCTVYSYDRLFRRGQYPLLVNELLTAGWTQQDIADAQHVFWPVGPVTTDIAVPVYNGVSGLWENNTNNTETRRRVLHLLFAFRDYFYQQNGNDLSAAAKSAAQVVANLIDYSDDDAIVPTSVDRQGPFYDDGVTGPVNYGAQANVDCTFITEQIIEDMIAEVSSGLVPVGSMPFGLNAADIVFGYEKQPFISEVYADWDGGLPVDSALKAFGLEVVNPYPQTLDMENWALKIGKNTIFTFDSDPTWDVPEINSGRTVYHGSSAPASMTIAGIVSPDIPDLDTLDTLSFDAADNVEIQLLRPTPQWVSSNLGIDYIVADRISDNDMRLVLGTTGSFSIQRDDDDWKFIHEKYASATSVAPPYELGTENTSTISGLESFQIGVADDGQPLARWHELEVLGLYGNGPESSDPNAIIQTVSSTLADPSTSLYHFDLAGVSSDLLDYIATINRPNLGTLPGRININTAPVHVIAAAIPPTLADPNAADPAETVTFSALQLADAIVNERQNNGAYTKLSDLLTRVPEFKQYDDSGTGVWVNENVGAQSIEDDIEEEHWILSNLANKFTVRSDVFTAYILVRLGEDGPQRRMIGIFDRSQVWNKNDRPKLVALHPVLDPR